MTTGAAGPALGARSHPEQGQLALLILGLSLIAITLVAGGLAATSTQLARIRLLDVADGAALDAADGLDPGAYRRGVGRAVPLSGEGVRRDAARYLGEQSLPRGVTGWSVEQGTGTPDGVTALVRLTGDIEVPVMGGLLSALGGSITVTVESRARAAVER